MHDHCASTKTHTGSEGPTALQSVLNGSEQKTREDVLELVERHWRHIGVVNEERRTADYWGEVHFAINQMYSRLQSIDERYGVTDDLGWPDERRSAAKEEAAAAADP